MDKVMGWVEKLPGVQAPVLDERKRIEEIMERAAAVAQRAADLQAEAAHLRAEAYRQGLGLKRQILEHWTIDEVNQAEQS